MLGSPKWLVKHFTDWFVPRIVRVQSFKAALGFITDVEAYSTSRPLLTQILTVIPSSLGAVYLNLDCCPCTIVWEELDTPIVAFWTANIKGKIYRLFMAQYIYNKWQKFHKNN